MESRNRPSDEQWVEQQLASARISSEWVPDTSRGLLRLRQRRASAHTRRRTTILTVGIGVAGFAGAMTIPQAAAFAERCAAACISGTGQVTQFVLDRVRSTAAAPAHKRQERQLAPDFSMLDQSGRTLQLSSLRGRVVLLNFWATWCPPCRAEMPWFVEFEKAYASKGLSVVGVSVHEDGWEPVRPFLKDAGINYPIGLGGDALIQLYGGLNSLPTTFLIDRTGRIAATHIGIVSKETYEAQLRTLLEER